MSNPIAQTVRLLEQELEVTQGRCHELERALETLRPLAGDVSEADEPKAPRRKKALRKSTPAADVDDNGTAILAMLKKHGGVMKPGELAAALKLTVVNLRYRLKPLVKSKQVAVTGTTMSRRVSLPGKPGKEAP